MNGSVRAFSSIDLKNCTEKIACEHLCLLAACFLLVFCFVFFNSLISVIELSLNMSDFDI